MTDKKWIEILALILGIGEYVQYISFKLILLTFYFIKNQFTFYWRLTDSKRFMKKGLMSTIMQIQGHVLGVAVTAEIQHLCSHRSCDLRGSTFKRDEMSLISNHLQIHNYWIESDDNLNLKKMVRMLNSSMSYTWYWICCNLAHLSTPSSSLLIIVQLLSL